MFLRAFSCSLCLSPHALCVSPQYMASFPSFWQVWQLILYVQFLLRQLPGLLWQGLQLGRVHDSSFHGAWFPKLSSRVWPNFSRTLTLPHLLPSITLLSMFWISFFSSDSGVKGTNRTFSGGWVVFFWPVGGLGGLCLCLVFSCRF